MKLKKIIGVLESIASPELKEDWDNVGLMIGTEDKDVDKILIALDFNSLVLEEAIKLKANLIITHHPLIFNPLKNITDERILKAIKNDIAVYSMHTNLDNAVNGVNYALSEKLGIYNCLSSGMIRFGYIPETTFGDYIDVVKRELETSSVRTVGNPQKTIRKVAVLGGSGGSMLNDAFPLNCDLYITGECAYNYALDAFERGLCVIAAGHFETENPVVAKLKKMLELRIDAEIFESKVKNIYKTV